MTEYNINSQFTLVERGKILSADGRISKVLDVMDRIGVPEFLKDVPYFGCNQGLRHRIVRTTGRPVSTRRPFYGGVKPNIATTQVVYEPVVLFEQRSEVDEDIIDTAGGMDSDSGKSLRRGQDESHIKGLLDDFVKAIFTDTRTSGAEYIDGLGARLTTLSYPGYATSESLPYVWDNGGAAGTNSLCSLWIVEWGENSCHALYPAAGSAPGTLGVDARNKGKEPKGDVNDATKIYYTYVSQFKKWAGLAVIDDWKVARIANINKALAHEYAINPNIVIQAIEHGKFDPGRTRIYCNAFVMSQINVSNKDKLNVEIQDVFGKRVKTAFDIPIRVLDTTILSATEAAVA